MEVYKPLGNDQTIKGVTEQIKIKNAIRRCITNGRKIWTADAFVQIKQHKRWADHLCNNSNQVLLCYKNKQYRKSMYGCQNKLKLNN